MGDMPAHVRTVLTQSEMTLPIAGGRCVLGTWQGIYLWEHRHARHRRRLTVTVQGSRTE
jgi:secondary thiamine-phosphate synthase enzyme